MSKLRWLVVAGAIILTACMLLYATLAPSPYRRDERARSEIGAIGSAVLAEAKRRGAFVAGENGLQALVDRGDFDGRVLIDAWGQRIRLICLDASCSAAVLYSCGPNAKDEEGKGDDIAVVLKLR